MTAAELHNLRSRCGPGDVIEQRLGGEDGDLLGYVFVTTGKSRLALLATDKVWIRIHRAGSSQANLIWSRWA